MRSTTDDSLQTQQQQQQRVGSRKHAFFGQTWTNSVADAARDGGRECGGSGDLLRAASFGWLQLLNGVLPCGAGLGLG